MTEHYFTKKPTSKAIFSSIRCDVNNTSFNFKTGSGVFAKRKVDTGTLLLIKKPVLGKEVLDLGCGYGAVGIILKRLNPDCNVTCSDINERAVKLTNENAQSNRVNVIVVQSDMFDNLSGKKFDTVLVNLPQNAGKDICFQMIEKSFQHLNEGGTLQAVSRHQKGGKQYEQHMKDIFGNVDALTKGSGYRVYISRKD
ncbi:class I SAM-dependent methyltransferase [Candidatus Woesearchaeota archaeon]|nr:class I SAM-dependent methyltransferase [Candidatus Woesearchaeota archaeon]